MPICQLHKHRLKSGLSVVCLPDPDAPLTTLNIAYHVGARNEQPDRTGFAHLFEHLMFGGSKNVPDFDQLATTACAEANAFTTNDLTNFFITLPDCNLETAFLLESDRLREPNLDQQHLDVQRKVVIEEFNERYKAKPYGDLQHLVRALAYKRHPYRWPTIGLTPQHIEAATLDDVKLFFSRNYAPDNASLVVCGNVTPDRVFRLAEKHFDDICRQAQPNIPDPEPPQTEPRRQEVTANVPATRIVLAWHMDGLLSDDYPLADLLTDLLAEGESSRLPQRLVYSQHCATDVNAYVLGSHDPGLLFALASVAPDANPEQVETALLDEVARFANEPVANEELQKALNRMEANHIFGLANAEVRAQKVAECDLLQQPLRPLIFDELFRGITPQQLQDFAQRVCKNSNLSTLIYRKA